MPYKSDAQRRFFHTDTAKKKGITDKEVNEFDQASKGMKLPEKKMAEGGEVAPEMKDDQFTHGVRDGMFNGIQGDWEALKKAVTDTGNKIHEKYIAGMGDTGNLKGLQNIMDKKAGKEPQMADGGMLDSLGNVIASGAQDVGSALGKAGTFLNQYNPINSVATALASQAINRTPNAQGMPRDIGELQALEDNPSLGKDVTPPTPPQPPTQPQQVNPISQTMQTAQQTAPTAPSIYQGISADDRANLMQQLIAQKSAPGMLAAKGAAGLGDAITSAFGKAPTNALGNMRQNEQQNMEQRVGVMDTERQQKLQDLQASIAQQENDPKSAYSNSMRDFYSQWTGRKVPSNVTASQLKSLAPEITKMFDTQTQSATARFKTAEEAQKAGADQGFFHSVGQSLLQHMGQPAEEFETALGKTAGIETPIQPAYAQNAQGHTIVSKDGGKSWQPIQ